MTREVLNWAMAQRARRRGQDGSVAPPLQGPLGIPAESAYEATNARLRSAIADWRRLRRLRRADSLDGKIAARENLRDFKRDTGDH